MIEEVDFATIEVEPHTYAVGDEVIPRGSDTRRGHRLVVVGFTPDGRPVTYADGMGAKAWAPDCLEPAPPPLPKVKPQWGYDYDGRFDATANGQRASGLLGEARVARQIRGVLMDCHHASWESLHGLTLAVVCDADGTPLEIDESDDR